MKVIKVIKNSPTQDGDGVHISRIADFEGKNLDPFLMIDEINSDNEADYIGGFPPHPHRGIETFTYMLEGGFEHQDQMGNRKMITSGDVQWMSTGYGVVHSEMPVASSKGLHGFQIWLNMPAKDKLRPAIYQDSVGENLPLISLPFGVSLKALAGSWRADGQEVSTSLFNLSSNSSIADLTLPPGQSIGINCDHADRAFVYIYQGDVNTIGTGHLILVEPSFPMRLFSNEGGRALIFAGNQIKEKIAHLGPFVMNSEAELRQAIEDYRAGRLGTI